MVTQFLFFFLAVAAIVAALGLVLARNPVTSALWLILNLFCIAGLYLTLNAQFIAVIQVIIYAGAIMVLFLFVIMLLNLGALPRLTQLVNWRLAAAFVLAMAVLAQVAFIIADGLDLLPEPGATETAIANGTATNIAHALFTQYALPFEVVGVLLLAATIGAVLLAKRRFV